MNKFPIYTLDLDFQGKDESIASYLIPHDDGVALFETGPGSTLRALQAGLAAHRFTFGDVTHVFLTHIHLDHAGASGYLASQGALIHVHPVGAPHMRNPEKLIASATRIYGDRMQSLWGDFLPVPAGKLLEVQDGQVVEVGGLVVKVLHTPGHAEHHCCYLAGDVCFSGDVGGVRIPGYRYLRLPFVPPELHIEKWRETVKRLQAEEIARIAPMHFGIFDDAAWHLEQIASTLDAVEAWLVQVMPADPPLEQLREMYRGWMFEQAAQMGLSPEAISAFELANPLGMSADGLQRYWKKHRSPQV